jgi:hypothetical protein
MATTSNTYTGNGSNKLFSITYPYLDESDIDVYLNGTLQTITTQYFFANATTIEFVTAPSNGAVILLKRSTDDTDLKTTFFPGSLIRSSDLNDNFDQGLFIAQETTNTATAATTSASNAVTTANNASANASAAVSTANTANSNATAAVSTANTAASNASAAVSTANTASSNASAAVSTANSAAVDAATAISTANGAVTTANNASSTANAAAAAVATVVPYTKVAAVANIPASPTNNQAIEIADSTGIESFSPLSSLPAGYIGSPGLSIRIVYSTSTSSWTFIEYFANDPETRYLKVIGGTMTGALVVPLASAATPSLTFTGDLDTGFWSPSADALAASTAGNERLRITSAGLGVGTSSPQSLLDVNGLATFAKGPANGITIGDVSTNSGSVLRLQGTSLGRNWQIANNINVAGIEFTPSTADGGTTFTTPAVAFTSTGRVGIGTSSPANQLQLSTDSAGKPSTNTWTIVSDERIKEEIELADLDLCYEAVKNIPLKRFKWKDEVYTEEQVRDRRKLGWIAQDVEAVFPKAVSTHEFKYNQVFEETIIPAVEEVLDDEGNVTTPAQPERIEKGELISEDAIEDCRDLNSDQLYAAMYGAIQKLMIKVETLETELAALKAP